MSRKFECREDIHYTFASAYAVHCIYKNTLYLYDDNSTTIAII